MQQDQRRTGTSPLVGDRQTVYLSAQHTGHRFDVTLMIEPSGCPRSRGVARLFFGIIECPTRGTLRQGSCPRLSYGSSNNGGHAGVRRFLRDAANIGGQSYSYGFAYCSALITSSPTKRSFPSTQASWPGGMVYESPATMVFWVPSFRRTVRRPETAYPTWETWHESVLTTGLMDCDQRHPGSKLKRPMVKPSSRTTSTRAFSGLRTSSGEPWDFTSNLVTATGVAMCFSSPSCWFQVVCKANPG